ALKWRTQNILNQEIDPFQCFSTLSLPIYIVFPSLRKKQEIKHRSPSSPIHPGFWGWAQSSPPHIARLSDSTWPDWRLSRRDRCSDPGAVSAPVQWFWQTWSWLSSY